MSWRRVLPEKLSADQLLIQFLVFYKTCQHGSSLLFSQQLDTHLIFSSPTPFCSHIYSSLNNIPIMAHMFGALQLQCWHSKMRNKKSETLTNYWTPNQMYRSQIGTNNTWCSSNLKPHQPYPTLHILDSNNQTLNSVHKNKHNPQNKPSALNMHNQNPNITTAEILMVLLQ